VNTIPLNLSSRPFRNNLVVGTILAVGAAAVVLATVSNVYFFMNHGGRYEQVKQEERQHLERLGTLETEERGLAKEIQVRDFRRLYGRGQYAGELILKRAFSWTLLFNHLENVIPPEVMMTAIRPQITAQGIVIRVDGIAKNHDALYGLEDTLQKNPVFTHVQPLTERKINPGRPDTSFAMSFDYLPAKAAVKPAAVASGATPALTAAPPAAPVVAHAGPAGAGAAPAPVLGTVGRDGRPRTPELLARFVAAPGGFYPETPPAAQEPGDMAKKSKGRTHEPKPASNAAPQNGTTPAPPAASRGSAPGSAATWQDGPNYLVARPPIVPGQPPRRDPNQGARPALNPRPETAVVREPVPARRLDVPLKFATAPVGEVYAALGVAHGVTFVIDPAVDRRTTVTADLAGKNLKEALAMVSRLAGHKVVREDEKLYRVFPAAGGEPMAEKPLQEETLPAAGVHP